MVSRRLVFLFVLLGLLYSLSACQPAALDADQPPVLTMSSQAIEPVAATDVPQEELPKLLPSDTPLPTEAPIEKPQTEEPLATQLPAGEPVAEAEISSLSGWIAIIDQDDNVWLVKADGTSTIQITTDAEKTYNYDTREGRNVSYRELLWSPDGSWLAYQRLVTQGDGPTFEAELWIYGLEQGDSRKLLSGSHIAGVSWRPDLQAIAYGMPVPEMTGRGTFADPIYGIWEVAVDTGEQRELVAPKFGHPLVVPLWSPNGRYLAFEEVIYIEGRGNFAYYDFEQQEYRRWEEPIGSRQWTPDGEQLIFDRVLYFPEIGGQIYLSDLQRQNLRELSPANPNGYATNPVISPDGQMIAFYRTMDVNAGGSMLWVIGLDGSNPRSLISTEGYGLPSWSPDSAWVSVLQGAYPDLSVVAVNVNDLGQVLIASGLEQAWQPLR